jgi:hypothetical protein
LVHEDSATELEQVRLQAARQFFKEWIQLLNKLSDHYLDNISVPGADTSFFL